MKTCGCPSGTMSSLLMTLPAVCVGMNIGVGAQGGADLAEPSEGGNPPPVTLSWSMHRLIFASTPLTPSRRACGGRAGARSSCEPAVAEGDTVIASSECAARRAESLLPTPPKRLRIVRAGMDLSKLQPERVSGRRVSDVRASWGVASHERIVLMPARLAAGRGQQTLIEAAALIKGQGLDDVRFVLAGGPGQPPLPRRPG